MKIIFSFLDFQWYFFQCKLLVNTGWVGDVEQVGQEMDDRFWKLSCLMGFVKDIVCSKGLRYVVNKKFRKLYVNINFIFFISIQLVI